MKGFRVLGIEANPKLFREVFEKFQRFIANGQLTLLNQGIWSETKVLTFYSNLDNDHWSSFDPAYGCRNGTRYETLQIECTSIAPILKRFGVPRYMKIDIEGADSLVLAQFHSLSIRPPFVSVEEYGISSIDALHALGYERFQIIPQGDKRWCLPPRQPREGCYVSRTFGGQDSGLFGRELPGKWMSYADARTAFVTNIRREDGMYIGPQGEWFDIHAAASDAMP